MKLAETIAIRAGDRLIPLIEAGTELPVHRRETLSTARDAQPSVRCELAVEGRSTAFVEVGVKSAPRGVPQVQLELRVDADGSVQVRMMSEDGSANAAFSVHVG